jgi:hypothetical protein
MSKNQSKLLADFQSLKKSSKRQDLLTFSTNEILDLVLLKDQIEFERTKIIQEEAKQIGSMKRFLSKKQPFPKMNTTAAAKAQAEYRVRIILINPLGTPSLFK